MDAITLEAQKREAGKAAARQTRREGNVPCILYGHHTQPVAFQLPELTLKQLIYTAETHVVNVEVDGERWNCILKSYDMHPVTDRPMHADFQVLEKGELITLTVPIQYHGTPIGQREGGDTQIILHEIEARCLPQDIPSHIDVDVSGLNVGDSLHVSSLDLKGVELLGRTDQTLVTVVPPRVLEVEEEVEVELDEEGEPIVAAEDEEKDATTGDEE